MNLEKLFEEAQIKRNNGQIEEAVVEYQKIRKQALQINNQQLAADCLHMIGVAYKQVFDHQLAQDYLAQAKIEFEKIGNQVGVGAVLRDQGVDALNDHNLSLAEQLMSQSIENLINTDQKGHLGISQAKLGLIWAARGKFDEAESKIKEGIGNIEQSSDRFFELTAWKNLAEIQIRAGEKEKARQSLQKAIEILNLISNSKQFLARRREFAELEKQLGSTS